VANERFSSLQKFWFVGICIEKKICVKNGKKEFVGIPEKSKQIIDGWQEYHENSDEMLM
jgi:hypothetical protein